MSARDDRPSSNRIPRPGATHEAATCLAVLAIATPLVACAINHPLREDEQSFVVAPSLFSVPRERLEKMTYRTAYDALPLIPEFTRRVKQSENPHSDTIPPDATVALPKRRLRFQSTAPRRDGISTDTAGEAAGRLATRVLVAGRSAHEARPSRGQSVVLRASTDRSRFVRSWTQRQPVTNHEEAATRAAERVARESYGMISDEMSVASSSSPEIIPDRRLALMFACAHPAIDRGIRAPLILQTILGFTGRSRSRW